VDRTVHRKMDSPIEFWRDSELSLRSTDARDRGAPSSHGGPDACASSEARQILARENLPQPPDLLIICKHRLVMVSQIQSSPVVVKRPSNSTLAPDSKTKIEIAVGPLRPRLASRGKGGAS
jgi:hypothetical protein